MKAANGAGEPTELEHGSPVQEKHDGHGYREIGDRRSNIRGGMKGDEMGPPKGGSSHAE